MQSEKLTMELLSDTTFSANFGAAIDVDVEIDHDELGCPVVSGKTLRGLLRDTWLSLSHCFPELAAPADRVLGTVGDLEETGILRIGPATVDPTSHALLANAVRRNSGPTARMILLAFTTVRHQTAEDRLTGAPVSHSLRSSRALIRCLKLHATLQWMKEPSQEDYTLLSLLLLGTRQAGCGRNRGKGHVRLTLNDDLGQTLNHIAQLQ